MPPVWPNPLCLASPEAQKEVLRLWAEGKRVRECGRATNLPDGSIWNILQKNGINPRGRALAGNKRIKIQALLAQGLSVNEIASQLDTSADYVRQFRRKQKPK